MKRWLKAKHNTLLIRDKEIGIVRKSKAFEQVNQAQYNRRIGQFGSKLTHKAGGRSKRTQSSDTSHKLELKSVQYLRSEDSFLKQLKRMIIVFFFYLKIISDLRSMFSTWKISTVKVIFTCNICMLNVAKTNTY